MNMTANTTQERQIEIEPSHPLTHMGNAERFVDQHGQDVRYVPKTKTWFVWDGKCWVPDDLLTVNKWMSETVRSILNEAAVIDDAALRETFVKWERQSESAANIEGAITQVKHMVACAPTIFNRSDWLLNFQNGTLNLETKELYAHRREDFITVLLPYQYN